ncbi:MAG TPA: hypothetical protein VHS97_07525 [Isosphaeraceae bacterium]|nr:hypothetical protein [Isosphaeraceae bacterium]
MRRGYSIRVSEDDWDSPEVRLGWARLIAGSLDSDLLGKCPEFVDHLRSTNDPSRFYLATVRDAAGSICGVVPLCIAPSGLKFEISGKVLAESRSPAVRILGSVPLLPADPVAHDLLFATLHQGFSGCQAISMASVPTNSFLWDYVRESGESTWALGRRLIPIPPPTPPSHVPVCSCSAGHCPIDSAG